MSRTNEPISSPAAWRGRELFERGDWEWRLSAQEIGELERAARASADLPLESISREDFRLPTLTAKLTGLRASLETGSGAVRVRGLSPTMDEPTLARIFWGMTRHVGTPVSQSARGELLLHVRDEGFGQGDARIRGPHTSKRLSFHTDRCDVIAFHCLAPAQIGGDNDVISSVTVYNELLRRNPAALRVLCEPFVYLRHTVDSGNHLPYTLQPIFSLFEGHFAASFLRVLIDRADKEPGVPDLSEAQRAALDALEDVAEDPELYVRFRQEAGDLLFLNNWVTFHRRTAFEDHAEEILRRHLMRVWLSVSNSRPLDPRFKDHFGATAAGALRGGMRPTTRA